MVIIMLRLVSSDTNIFKSSFGAISSIVSIVEMELDSDGIRINAIDSSHITFVHLELEESVFDIYECDKAQRICFDIVEFLTYLKRAGKDTLLEIRVDENHIIVHIEGNTNKTFKLKLLDIENNTPPMPEIDYPVTINIPTKTFKDSISDIHAFTEKVKISNDNNVLKFTALGDFADVEVEWEHNQTITTSAESNYTLDKIKEMMKADKFSRECAISYGNDMPLMLELSSTPEEKLSFLLAPRIEEE